jgi:flagellar biosynthesis protein FlhB
MKAILPKGMMAFFVKRFFVYSYESSGTMTSMTDTLLNLMVVNLIILSAVLVVFLGFLIYVLVMVRRTILQVQRAVDSVETAALRSLMPLLSFKRMFMDLGGFVESVKSWAKVVPAKKKKSRSSDEE